QNAHIPELDSVAFDEAIYCYFDYLEVLIQESENNSVDEIFEKLYDEIPDIVDANINIYDDDLEKEAFKKFNYIFENHNEYFENFEPKKTKIYDVLRAAEYHMLEDFLFEFHDEFSNRLKAEFTKELELEQQNEISM
ncbi:hypothetical protein C4M83_05700, partial [Mycoplasmopsis pullorum]